METARLFLRDALAEVLPVGEAVGVPTGEGAELVQGVLKLTPRGEARLPHLAVDILFKSLAEDLKSRAIGVVLSGTGSDGSQGLAEIKAAGGITFAQDEASAKYSGMPISAETTTSTQIMRWGVAKRPCMTLRISGISLSCAIA